MKKISQILKESKIHQITGDLIEFDDFGKLLGKCAMGVLACESGKKELKLCFGNESVQLKEILMETVLK